MKPFSIVLSINLALFAIWGLFFGVAINRPELIPFFTSAQAAINVLAAGIFHLDRKASIRNAFLLGALLGIVVTAIGYFLLVQYQHLIGVEEGYTTFLHSIPNVTHLKA